MQLARRRLRVKEWELAIKRQETSLAFLGRRFKVFAKDHGKVTSHVTVKGHETFGCV